MMNDECGMFSGAATAEPFYFEFRIPHSAFRVGGQ
jgi:hypothetical protein